MQSFAERLTLAAVADRADLMKKLAESDFADETISGENIAHVMNYIANLMQARDEARAKVRAQEVHNVEQLYEAADKAIRDAVRAWDAFLSEAERVDSDFFPPNVEDIALELRMTRRKAGRSFLVYNGE